MLPAILGKKIGMSQVYDADGVLHPVTVVQAGPCSVLQIKTPESDGYCAVQIGYGEVKLARALRPQIGHAARASSTPKKFIREVRLAETPQEVALGGQVTVEVFDGVAFVDVTGTSKGHGYAGVMRRHHFKGQPASHGCERKHRSPGSIGSHSSNAGTGPKIKKGKKMAGHLGAVRRTSRNHRLIAVDKANNLLLIKGSLPGANGGFLYVKKSKTAKAGRSTG